MTESGAKLVLWVAAIAWVGARMAIPQPVAPWEMPSLVLDRAAVARDVELNQALADTLADGEEVRRLRSLFIDHGVAEVNPPYLKVDADNRQVDIHHAKVALTQAQGPEALQAMRAKAVDDFMATFPDLSREPESEEELGAVGGFRQMLERYGAIYEEVQIAPEMTVRAMYKARWNLIHRAPATDGFSPIELQAYWGWLALHGWGVPLGKRTDALHNYANAGGRSSEEAAALFDLLEGKPAMAANELQDLYEREHQLRLRNLALGALYASKSAHRGAAPP